MLSPYSLLRVKRTPGEGRASQWAWCTVRCCRCGASVWLKPELNQYRHATGSDSILLTYQDLLADWQELLELGKALALFLVVLE